MPVINLKNKYFLLRHGQSWANVWKIVVSSMEEGVKEMYSLTKFGKNQVRESIETAKEDGLLDETILIYSSPFSRCKRTAEIAREILEINQEIFFDERLRERWFGDLEGTDSSNDIYQEIHQQDLLNSEHKEWNIESLKELQKRMISVIHDLEKKYFFGRKILLVSHGDPLKSLEASLCGKPINSLEMLKTAELREIKQ